MLCDRCSSIDRCWPLRFLSQVALWMQHSFYPVISLDKQIFVAEREPERYELEVNRVADELEQFKIQSVGRLIPIKRLMLDGSKIADHVDNSGSCVCVIDRTYRSVLIKSSAIPIEKAAALPDDVFRNLSTRASNNSTSFRPFLDFLCLLEYLCMCSHFWRVS